MTDLDRALKTHDSWRKTIEKRYPKAFNDGALEVQAILAAAARAHRDHLANGERVEYCEKHRLLVRWEDATTCAAGAYSNDCRIVSKLLSDYSKEADNE